jgi:hypothetical protein
MIALSYYYGLLCNILERLGVCWLDHWPIVLSLSFLLFLHMACISKSLFSLLVHVTCILAISIFIIYALLLFYLLKFNCTAFFYSCIMSVIFAVSFTLVWCFDFDLFRIPLSVDRRWVWNVHMSICVYVCIMHVFYMTMTGILWAKFANYTTFAPTSNRIWIPTNTPFFHINPP